MSGGGNACVIASVREIGGIFKTSFFLGEALTFREKVKYIP